MFRLVLIKFCLILSLQAGIYRDPSKKICLNMIVKNESAVIQRSLNSAKPFIDYWVIVDTGSTDGTQSIIREVLKGIPGELHERPWINFEVNRNQALDLCKNKGDYVLFIDADEEFVFSDTFSLSKLDADSYFFNIYEAIENPTNYTRTLLINNHLNWHWKGVLHELIECQEAHRTEVVSDAVVISRSDEGARSKDPNKYLKDAAVLEEALKTDPNNSRYIFYLAQSYLNAKEYAKALKNYQKRSQMPGSNEEIFLSLYLSAYLQEKLELPPQTFIDSYWKAFHFRPIRAEPLYRLADYYKRIGYPLMGYLLATHINKMPYPKEMLFMEPWIYEWGWKIAAGECSAILGYTPEAIGLLEKALAHPNLPSNIREIELQNIETLKKIHP